MSSWTAGVAAVRRTRTTTLAMNAVDRSGRRTAISASGTGTATHPSGRGRGTPAAPGTVADGYCSTAPALAGVVLGAQATPGHVGESPARVGAGWPARRPPRRLARRPRRRTGGRRGIGQRHEVLTVVVGAPASVAAARRSSSPDRRRPASSTAAGSSSSPNRSSIEGWGSGIGRSVTTGRAGRRGPARPAPLGEVAAALGPRTPRAAGQRDADEVAVVVGVGLQQQAMPSLRISGIAPEYWRRAAVLSTAATTVTGCSRPARSSSASAVSASVSHSSLEVVDDHERPPAEAVGDAGDALQQPGAVARRPGRPCPRTGRGRAASGGRGRGTAGSRPAPPTGRSSPAPSSCRCAADRSTSTWPWSSGMPRDRRSTSPMANTSRSARRRRVERGPAELVGQHADGRARRPRRPRAAGRPGRRSRRPGARRWPSRRARRPGPRCRP